MRAKLVEHGRDLLVPIGTVSILDFLVNFTKTTGEWNLGYRHFFNDVLYRSASILRDATTFVILA